MPLETIIFLLGRILYGGFFVIMGVNHFTKTGMLTNYAQLKNIPYSRIAVYLTGLMLILGGLGVILGVYVTWSLWMLILFLLLTAFLIHNFWKAFDEQTKGQDYQSFLRNLALAGAALIMLSFPEPWILFVGV